MQHTYCKPTIIHDDLIRDLPEMNRFAATNFREQALSTPVFSLQLYGLYWSAARYIRDNEALANLANISRTRIKFGLQYVFYLFTYNERKFDRTLNKTITCPITCKFYVRYNSEFD